MTINAESIKIYRKLKRGDIVTLPLDLQFMVVNYLRNWPCSPDKDPELLHPNPEESAKKIIDDIGRCILFSESQNGSKIEQKKLLDTLIGNTIGLQPKVFSIALKTHSVYLISLFTLYAPQSFSDEDWLIREGEEGYRNTVLHVIMQECTLNHPFLYHPMTSIIIGRLIKKAPKLVNVRNSRNCAPHDFLLNALYERTIESNQRIMQIFTLLIQSKAELEKPIQSTYPLAFRLLIRQYAKNGDLVMLRMLYKNYNKNIIETDEFAFEIKSPQGGKLKVRTRLLHHAAEGGQVRVIRWLRTKGQSDANPVQAGDSKIGSFALHRAVCLCTSLKQTETIEALLDPSYPQSAPSNVSDIDVWQRNPVHYFVLRIEKSNKTENSVILPIATIKALQKDPKYQKALMQQDYQERTPLDLAKYFDWSQEATDLLRGSLALS